MRRNTRMFDIEQLDQQEQYGAVATTALLIAGGFLTGGGLAWIAN